MERIPSQYYDHFQVSKGANELYRKIKPVLTIKKPIYSSE